MLSTSESGDSSSGEASPRQEVSAVGHPLFTAPGGRDSSVNAIVQSALQSTPTESDSTRQLLAAGNLHKENGDRFDEVILQLQALDHDLRDSPRGGSSSLQAGKPPLLWQSYLAYSTLQQCLDV